MKFGIFILRFTIVVLILSFAIYTYFFGIGNDGLEPIEAETIALGIFTILGVLSGILLIRRSGVMHRWVFATVCVLYFLLFTFPAVVSTLYMLAMMTAG